MTVSDSAFQRLFTSKLKLPSLIVITLLGIVAMGLTAAEEPFWALGTLVAILFLLILFKWPDTATLLVVFYIYTNIGPVAMKYYGVPPFIAMGFSVLLTIPLIAYLLLRREKIIITPVFLWILALAVIYTLGAAFSRDITLASTKLFDFFFEGILLYFFLINVIRTPLMLKRVVWVLLVSGALIGGLALYQQVTQTFDNNYGGFAQVQTDSSFGTGVEQLQGEVTQERLSGSIGEKNRFAQNMLMLVPLGLFQFWIYRSFWARILALLFTSLIIMGGALAFSRGAAVSFILLIIIMVFLRYIKLYQLVPLILGGYLILWMFPQYGDRIATLNVFAEGASTGDSVSLIGADGAIRGRATDILAALRIFQDYPLIGVGPGMVQYYTREYSRDLGLRYVQDDPEAHSLFPGIAAESGILGLICFVAILYIALRDLMRARKQWMESHPDWSYMATAFFQVLISYVVTGLFLHMSYMRFFYLMLALAVAASSFKNADTQVEKEEMDADLVLPKSALPLVRSGQ